MASDIPAEETASSKALARFPRGRARDSRDWGVMLFPERRVQSKPQEVWNQDQRRKGLGKVGALALTGTRGPGVNPVPKSCLCGT